VEGGLTLGGIIAPTMLDGAKDGPAFLAWVEQMLVPVLTPGKTVVSNLPAHSLKRCVGIEACGATLRYLPSPTSTRCALALSCAAAAAAANSSRRGSWNTSMRPSWACVMICGSSGMA